MTYFGSGHLTPKEAVLKHEIGHMGPEAVKRIEARGNHVYAAIQVRDGVVGFVFVLRKDRGDWNIRAMDESMGPNECKASKILIDTLTPIEDMARSMGVDPQDRHLQWSKEWRDACVQNATSKAKTVRLRDGIQVRFPKPVWWIAQRYPHMDATRFTVRRYGRRGWAFQASNGKLFRLSVPQREGMEIVKA